MILKNTKEYIKNKKNQDLYGVAFIQSIHPGATLQDELDFFSISQKELAKKIGYSIQTVNRIVKGKEPITTDIALALERVFDGRPLAQFWLNMQSNYDKKISRMNELEETKKEITFFKEKIKTTFKELQKGGVFGKYILNSENNYKKSIIDIKDFFGSHSLQSISNEILLGVPFRKYKRENTNQYNLAAILKIGEREARKILRENIIKKYSERDFVKKLGILRKLTNKKPREFLKTLQKECLNFGVIVVYVPNMSKTFFGGATIWINDYPIILLKTENQWEDIFWFNFYHEVGHILKHGKKEIFINFDEDNRKNKIEKVEIEANEFASEILMPNFEKTNRQIRKGILIDERIDIISKKFGVSKSIVVGRLCLNSGLKDVWRKFSNYRPIIKEKASFV